MKQYRGFTLIELLVVIAIIGLLSAVVFASLSTARMKSRDARRISDLDQIKTALELYYDDHGYYPPSACGWNCNGYSYSYNSTWGALATQTAAYIPQLPTDPLNGTCAVWAGPNCHSYEYGNVGRTYGTTTGSVDAYDLYAMFETPNHPLGCPQVAYYYGRGIGGHYDLCAYGADIYAPASVQ